MKANKYHSQKAEFDGMVFDSRRELNRYRELKLMESAGLIVNLRRQVKYVLIPVQRETSDEVYKRGDKKGLPKPGRVIEKECAYIADFVYFDVEKQDVIVEDTKGFRTKDYTIKRKLMLYRHGIRIKEI